MASNFINTNVPVARPDIVRAIHPARDAVFRALAASTTTIRTARDSYVVKGCSHAPCPKTDKTPGVELQKCAKCKSVWYCSKKCQKEDWSVHKIQCHDVERGLSKLITAFLVNPLLRSSLEMALCLDFDFVNNPAPDTPHMARIDVGLEPSDITVTLGLYAGSRWLDNPEPEKIEGMLQINAITRVPPGIVPHPRRLALWNETRQKLRAEGKRDTPVVIVEFISNDSPNAFSSVLEISPPALMLAKKREPFEHYSLINGTSRDPMTVETTLEFINMFIRSDKDNQVLLRMNMREEDKALFRAAGRGESSTAISIFKEKMERERTYRLYDSRPT